MIVTQISKAQAQAMLDDLLTSDDDIKALMTKGHPRHARVVADKDALERIVHSDLLQADAADEAEKQAAIASVMANVGVQK